jgi:hypothetical protein
VKNVVFGVIDFNFCEIAFFRFLSKLHSINKAHLSNSHTSPPQTTAKLSVSFMVIVESVKVGESTANKNYPHLDLDIFRVDFNHSEKEIIGVRKNVVFGESIGNFCEITFFSVH